MSIYDEKIILKKGIVSKQQLSNLKAHLYKQILKRRSKQKYYPEKVVLRIFQQICKGVCALHEMGIIHRDIKTLNILLDKPKNVTRNNNNMWIYIPCSNLFY